MNIISKLKSTIEDVSSAGAKKVNGLRDAQQRKGLLAELGELRYREHLGETIDETAYTAVLTDLDNLSSEPAPADTDGDDSEEAAAVAAGDEGEDG